MSSALPSRLIVEQPEVIRQTYCIYSDPTQMLTVQVRAIGEMHDREDLKRYKAEKAAQEQEAKKAKAQGSKGAKK